MPVRPSLLVFFRLYLSDSSAPHFLFSGQELHLSQSAKHLGHVLSYNLSDSEDIQVKKDLVRKANCILYSSSCSFLVKTKVLSSFCLSLYGSALWFSSSPDLSSLETTFNNILRRIWSLPRMCHTGILHCVAKVDSLFNIVLHRASKLSIIAMNYTSQVVREVFSQSSALISSSLGYNAIYGYRNRKIYSLHDSLCADFMMSELLLTTTYTY